MTKITPVILCGGAGQRLWPLSRETHPKQFHALAGDRSLFQATIDRVSSDEFAEPIIVTGSDHRFLVAEQLREMGAQATIVLEPMRRDSCAAIAAAAGIAARTSPEAPLLVLAADHAIDDTGRFRHFVSLAAAGARSGRIVTFGIKPSEPATGYGYLKHGAAIAGLDGVHTLEAFVEKPDAATARDYLSRGYLWNSGNFLFAANVFLSELEQHAPGVAGPVAEAVAQAHDDLDFVRLQEDAFARADSISVDYAVMEKTDKAAVVPSDFGWSDVGTWAAVWDMTPKDDNGNAALGDAVFHNSSGSYVHSPHHLTCVAGLSDVAVVTMRDAVLVAPRQDAGVVKGLVAQLSALERAEVREHHRVYRPWGDYEQIDAGALYQVKRITVKPAGILSLQSHKHRAEHWVVVSGTARVTVDGETFDLQPNQSTYIPLGAVHRLENPGMEPLEMIEVQSGDYLGEDDIVRYEDVYGRS